jgi:predicted metal-dependent phosphoesterase TrpH
MLFDLHVHSELSPCSVLAVAQIVDRARAAGLDGVCITDHNTTALRRQVAEGVRPDGLCLLVGMEYDTPEGDFLLFGDCDDLGRGLATPQLLDLMAKRDGVAVAAHPGRHGRGLREDLLWDRSCTILETLNGRNSEVENYRAEILRRVAGAVGCGRGAPSPSSGG